MYAVRNRPWFNIRGQVVSSQFTAEVTNAALLQAFPDRTAVLGGKSIGDYIRTAGGRALYLPGDNLDLPTVNNVTIGFATRLFANTTLEVDGIHQKQSHLQTGHDANLPAAYPHPGGRTIGGVPAFIIPDSEYIALTGLAQNADTIDGFTGYAVNFCGGGTCVASDNGCGN